MFSPSCKGDALVLSVRRCHPQSAEVGHVHTGGIVDIPFPRSVRDALLADGLAEEHRWVPNSGWDTFRIRIEDDLKHALWLLRLSYLRYTLKHGESSAQAASAEGEELRLSPQFRSLLEKFVPRAANQVSTEALPA
jgi:hypothetical protein